jgi:hypothetical protein
MPLFLFILNLYVTYIHSFTFLQYIHPSSFAEVSLHLLIAGQLSGKNLPGVPSRESNSGLPSSKPTHRQLSYVAPSWATPHPRELRRTLKSYAAPFEPRRTLVSYAPETYIWYIFAKLLWQCVEDFLYIIRKKYRA